MDLLVLAGAAEEHELAARAGLHARHRRSGRDRAGQGAGARSALCVLCSGGCAFTSLPSNDMVDRATHASSLARQLERAKQPSILASPTARAQPGPHGLNTLHQQTDLSPTNWGEAPGAALERSLSLSPAADRAHGSSNSPAAPQRVSPARSPRASPNRIAGRGSSEPPATPRGPSLSQTLAAHERVRLSHEDFEDPDEQLRSPERKGVLGSKAQERGTAVASGGLGRLPERALSFEAFHKRFASTPPGAFADGDTSTLVQEAERQARAARSRTSATAGYPLPGSAGFVSSSRPKSSRLHHNTRVTTGASFLDAEMPDRTSSKQYALPVRVRFCASLCVHMLHIYWARSRQHVLGATGPEKIGACVPT